MKKQLALVIIGLFIISLIPSAFAENMAESIRSRIEQREGNVLGSIANKTERIEKRLEIMATTAEQIRERQKERLMNAVDKCKETNLSSELCEKKLENRVQLINKLQENDLQRIQKIEQRRLQKLNELKEFKSNANLSMYNKTNNFKVRKIAQAKLINLRQDYIKAKEKYQLAKKDYISAQNGFKEAKIRFKECEGNNSNSTECAQYREEINERAKEFLLKTADNIIEHLNKIKANVEANEDLSDEEADEIIAKIDEMIKEIEDAKAKVESSQSKEEILEAAKTIKQKWVEMKKRLLIYTGRVINAGIGGIIVKAKHLEVKLERILARMEEKGINTTSIQPLIDQFNSKINEAKTNYENALGKFKEAAAAQDVETAHQLAVEGHKFMKDAHKALQDAQKILRDIVKGIKDAGGEEELTAPEDEAEEGAEETG